MRASVKSAFIPAVGLGVLALGAGTSGCASAWKSPRVAEMESETARLQERLAQEGKERQRLLARVGGLEEEIGRLERERADEAQRLIRERELAARQAAEQASQESEGLIEAQRRLAEGLKKELGEARAKLAMTERGLVLTFLDEVFFDSGKAVIKPQGLETLQRVAEVLKETVPGSPVAVEGHTDNDPIRYSGWRSNWELSAGRALSVVHHFVEGQGIDPDRLRALAFGEYQPVESNDTPEGRRQNRRVEVVILPKALTKEKPAS